MTAGAGVVHAEMPSAKFMRTGGRMHGFQFWVNLPRQDKMMQPRYQEIPSRRKFLKQLQPTAWSRVSVIAGEAMGAKAVIETRHADHLLALPTRAGRRGDAASAATIQRLRLRR